MIKKNILVVDDEPTQCKTFSKFITNMGHGCLTMNSGSQVVDFFINKKPIDGINCHEIDVMLLDLIMPDIDGLTVLKQIAPIKGDLEVIVLTANHDIKSAVTAINLGAIDYIVKGERDVFARLNASITNAIEKRNLRYQVSNLERKDKNQVSFSDIFGQSEPILNALKLAKKAVNSSIPILLEGPVGSGKELLARAIHGSGTRVGKPFIVVECGSLKGNAEEVLFGSEGMVSDPIKSMGKIREASNGTVFFERIDLLRPDLQVKVLRFLQEGEFEPVRSKSSVRVNVRIISSTTKDLTALVEAGKFREDLRYRIETFPIKIPGLKERGNDDIRLLAETFCRNFSINENKKIKGISNSAAYLLWNYEWEENVRQLKNVIFRAVVLCDGEMIQPEHLPQLLNKEQNNLTRAKSIIKKNSEINSELIDLFDDNGKCKSLELVEEEAIRRLVDIYNGNLSEVAKQLDVGRSTVYRKLKIAD